MPVKMLKELREVFNVTLFMLLIGVSFYAVGMTRARNHWRNSFRDIYCTQYDGYKLIPVTCESLESMSATYSRGHSKAYLRSEDGALSLFAENEKAEGFKVGQKYLITIEARKPDEELPE